MKKIVLGAAFLLIGTFAMAQQNRSKMQQRDPAQMEQKRAENLKMMQTELNLSSAQVAQIKAMQDKKMADRKANAPQMQAERKARMEIMQMKKEEWKKEMKQILTAEQYKKWEATRQNKMQNNSKSMNGKRMQKMQSRN